MVTRKLKTIFVFASALLLLSGCFWSKKDDDPNAPAELVEVQPTANINTVWSVKVGESEGYSFSPVYAQGSIFAASADGTVMRISETDGTKQWEITAETPLIAGVGSDGDTVAVVGRKGVLMAFDGEGKLRWEKQMSSEVISAPLVIGNMVVVRGVDNRISSYDAETGERRWMVNRPLPTLTIRSSAGMVVAGPTAVVTQPGGKLLSFMLINGGLRWETSVGRARGATELERLSDIAGYPAIYGNAVCAAAYKGRVACLDVVSGREIWTQKFSGGSGITVDSQNVYAVDDKDGIHALTLSSGESVWRNKDLSRRKLSMPTALGPVVAVADYEGYLHFLSSSNGSFVNRLKLDGTAVNSKPLLVNGKLIIQTTGGTLYAFSGG